MIDNLHYAIVFPGQGSQHIGMLSELAQVYPQVQQTFAEVSDQLGLDFWTLAQQGPQEQLDLTTITQPIMLAADVAVWRCLQASANHLPAPQYMAGHSLGEYSALVCAQALTLSDASQLVQTRAELMQQATAPGVGAMAAILGLEDQVVAQLCEQCQQDQVLSPANYNSVGQCVVAGHTEAVERLIQAAQKAGAKIAKKIPVSVPSHCALMSPACEPFQEALQQISVNAPIIPIIHNTSVSTNHQPSEIKQLLLEQLVQPVRWVETILWLASQQVHCLVEAGPGQVLTKLNRRIDKAMKVFSLQTPKAIEQAVEYLQQTDKERADV